MFPAAIGRDVGDAANSFGGAMKLAVLVAGLKASVPSGVAWRGDLKVGWRAKRTR
jgi:hypothetical protein